MWHLTILAFYGLCIIGLLGIAGLLTAAYEWYENRNSLNLDSGLVFMRDFSDKRF
jgi:hypothetical protein